MKILILTPQLPYPPQQGASLRNYHIIRGLGERHEITLLSFLEDGQTTSPAVIAPLLKLCARIVTMPVPRRPWRRRLGQSLFSRRADMAHRLDTPAFAALLRRHLSEDSFDIVQIEGLELAQAIRFIRVVSPYSKIVFDNHNAETELQRRTFLADLSQPHRWLAAGYSWLQISRLRRFERWACRQADWITAVSENDRQHLENISRSHNRHVPITVVPNCLDVQQYQNLPLPGASCHYDLLFSGKMDYRPNVDAVLWFADHIWPFVRRQRPSTTWAVVGQKPHPRLDRLYSVDGITITGWVESIQPYLAGATVYIMPFRIGSGTRLKLIEAMAAGKAITSTPIGAEGFPVQHNQELLLAKTAGEFASTLLFLLAHPEERQRLGAAARQFAWQYDWRRVIPKFDEIYRNLKS
jgi:glycosyltransferase involved in cell wall biosynthesis